MSVALPRYCVTCHELVETFAQAAEEFGAAALALRASIGRPEFGAALAHSRDLREKCRRASQALRGHRGAHESAAGAA